MHSAQLVPISVPEVLILSNCKRRKQMRLAAKGANFIKISSEGATVSQWKTSRRLATTLTEAPTVVGR